jgi:ABC-type dipeptide/oligopeptide/nickel transport system permease component
MIIYIGKRLLYLIPQLLGISFVTFVLVRMLPGNPARMMAGPMASEEGIRLIETKMGLHEPIPVQFLMYIKRVVNGDLGTSWYTSNPVSVDLYARFPATLELISIVMFLIVVIMIPVGVITVLPKQGFLKKIVDRIVTVYGLLAGALPDFWLGLIFIFLFYSVLNIVPVPSGRLDIWVMAPRSITGMYLIDSLLTLNTEAFVSSLKHLMLPVITLVFVYGSPILKMTRSTMAHVLNSQFIEYAKACGLSNLTIMRYALVNSLPPVVTLVGVIYGFLLGGAVLVENLFGWGGVGQYAVQSIVNQDFAAMQGFVLVAAVFTLAIYLVIDLIYFFLDPRITL